MSCPLKARVAFLLVSWLVATVVWLGDSDGAYARWDEPRTVVGIPAGQVPQLTPEAKAAVLMDAATGAVLYAKNPDEPMAPASVTKVMTLGLIFESLDGGKIRLDDKVVASENAHDLGGSEIWLEPGESMKVSDLINAIAVGSANDASVALAEHIAGSEEGFVKMMNEKAKALGMRNSCFKNVHGLDEEGHVMSAMDVALASRYALSFPRLLGYTSKWEEYLRGGKSWLVNTNKLLVHYAGCDGIKTGSTDKAGFCVAATAKRDDTRLIAVIMNAPDSKTRFREASSLLDYGFANYKSVKIAKSGEVVAELPVMKGHRDTVGLVAKSDVAVTVKRDEKPEIKYKVVPVRPRNEAPVLQGDKLAEVVLLKDEKEVGRMDLFAAETVKRATFLELFMRVFRRWGFLYD